LRPRVYIAGPLSGSGDRLENVQRAIDAGLELVKLGYAPLVPHLTHFMDPDDSLGQETWYDVDVPWVLAADAVLRLPGKSRGADIECLAAVTSPKYIPVFNSIDELHEAMKEQLTLVEALG